MNDNQLKIFKVFIALNILFVEFSLYTLGLYFYKSCLQNYWAILRCRNLIYS